MAKDYDIAKKSVQDEILSKVANGVEPSFRSPVSAMSWVTTQANTITGTGKGVLHLYFVSNNSYTVIVDGVTLIDNSNTKINGHFSVEFTSSFSVVGLSNYNNIGVAVFY